MSLYEAADGILETHVTWEDVEKAMQQSLGTHAKFGENRKVTNISDMKGFMSRIAMVEPDWINVEEGKTLPHKFAVKISTQIALLALSKVLMFDGEGGFGEEKLKKLGVVTRECHNREVDSYELLKRFNHPDIPYLKVYAMKKFSDEHDLKGFLIMEFVPNIYSPGMHVPIPADELVTLIRGISTFSALSESLSPEEKKFAGGSDYLERMFREIFTSDSLKTHFSKMYAVFGEEKHKQVDKLVDTFIHYESLLKKYSKISELLGHKLVFNHGDLWQSNMIHTKDEDGKMKLVAMIDWQSTSILPPGLDTSRLMMGCLSTEDRREKGPELLRLYHQTFTEVHRKELFSFEELQDSYNLHFPMAAMLIIPGSISFMANGEMTENEKDETLEKITALMEDVLEVHELNLKKFPHFMRV